MEIAKAGMHTWSFFQVLYVNSLPRRQSHEIRRAFHALEDVGLVDIELDPRGGMATAKVTWTERAYLPKPKPRPVALAADDDNTLECIAAGIA